METKVILHNSISLDCSFVGLTPNMELHYRVVNLYKPDAYMVGSNTAKTGIAMFGETMQKETKNDFLKPIKDEALSYWIIPDTKGILKGLLHYYRRLEFCKDVIVLVSEKTPKDYLTYLDERHYDYLVIGEDFVDYRKAIGQLSEKYSIKTVLVDTGSQLGNVLLNDNLIHEISLILSPEIIGKSSKRLFEKIETKITLQCTNCELLNDGYIWVKYKINKTKT
jgi:2,5-diamino-6-(ribosylamino)-4(3H)-pyrimidinone 5'-phosphate reductase